MLVLKFDLRMSMCFWLTLYQSFIRFEESIFKHEASGPMTDSIYVERML